MQVCAAAARQQRFFVRRKYMLNRRNLLKTGGLAVGALGFNGFSIKAVEAATVAGVQNISITANGFVFDAIACGPTDGALVLCLHGFPEFKEAWTPVIQALGALGYYAVAVDQRGYSDGARPTAVTDYAFSNLVSDVMGFASFLGAEKFHLVGHDMGGTVAWMVGGQSPNPLLSLTILSTPHKNAFVPAYLHDPDQQSRSAYIATLQGPGGVSFMLGNNAANMFGSYAGFVPQANLFVSRFQQPGVMAAALSWYTEENFTVADGVIITIPAAYIWGSQDAFLGKLAAVNTANFVTGPYKFVQLSGRSHWLMDEVPQDIVTLLQQQFTTTLI